MSVKWLARVFASAVVRRCAYILVAAVLMTFCHRAKAADDAGANCNNNTQQMNCHTKRMAILSVKNSVKNRGWTVCSVYDNPNNYNVNAGSCGSSTYGVNSTWDVDDTATFCPSQPKVSTSTMGSTDSLGEYCGASDGCLYSPIGMSTTNENKTVGLKQADGTFSAASPSGWEPTSRSCSMTARPAPKPKTPYDPNKPVCQAVGTSKSQFCVQPGKECVVFADGTSQCWTPWALNPDVTPRTNKDGTQGAGISMTPDSSATPPKSMTNPTKIGDVTFKDGDHQGTMTMFSGSGMNGTASQENPASNGTSNGTGNNASSGNGNGNGNNDGNGDGDKGKCDGTGDCTNAGGAGQGVGKVYTKSGKTMSGVFGEFRSAVSNAPIIAAGRNFFTVSVSGGCPAFTLPATKYWNARTFDAHCSGVLATALAAGGYLLLAGFAYVAWKIAVG